MDLYEDLKGMFPYKISGSKQSIREAVEALVDPHRADVFSGSSFAVVSGIATDGKPTLWLSAASHRFLASRGIIAGKR